MPVSSLDLSVFSAEREVSEDEEAVRVIGTLLPDFSTEEAEICLLIGIRLPYFSVDMGALRSPAGFFSSDDAAAAAAAAFDLSSSSAAAAAAAALALCSS